MYTLFFIKYTGANCPFGKISLIGQKPMGISREVEIFPLTSGHKMKRWSIIKCRLANDKNTVFEFSSNSELLNKFTND